MQQFLHENFLLKNDAGRELYHEYAKRLPIIDYHNHLSPSAISQNHKFKNLTRIWLNEDHYKWRAMRAMGIDEKYITGTASDDEKFMKWAEVVPQTIRNPLFHWTHLELKNYFGIHDILSPKTAKTIYNSCNDQLNSEGFEVIGLLNKMNVEVICTTDRITDTLSDHQSFASQHQDIKMLPTFRPDDILEIDHPVSFAKSIGQLSTMTGINVTSIESLLSAIQMRVDFFHTNGGRLADHGLEEIYVADFDRLKVEKSFQKTLNGDEISNEESLAYKSMILFHLGEMYHDKQWVQQFHIGAMRNVNSKQTQLLGKDTGFDTMGDTNHAWALGKFLDKLAAKGKLAKTIVYNINPKDNASFAAMVSNFNDGSVKGKMQFGAAWWFLDTKEGMENQLNTLSNIGLLSNFIGMLTDSRSFLSFPRHEYFRRILCNVIGNDIENGELPYDIDWIGEIVQNICYYNAKEYFNF